MSNPNDPKKPTPEQPESPPPPATLSKGSFEFTLPPESEGGVAPPPAPNSDPSVPELPPVPLEPVARVRPGSNTFEFDLPEVDDEEREPPASPLDAMPSGDSVVFEPAAPTGDPSSAALSGELVDLGPGSTTNTPSSFTLGEVVDLSKLTEGSDPSSLALGGEVIDLAQLPGASDAVPSSLSSTTQLPEVPIVPLGDPASGVGDTKLIDPVKPASGWLDSDVISPPAAAPAAPPAAPPAEAVDSSDIFSGGKAPPAAPVGESDVISATAGEDAPGRPGEPTTRASDVALTFDAPPGGSTVDSARSGELLLADEVADSGSLHPASDPESIHDMDYPPPGGLFDSAKLAEAPDLPISPGDSPDYGTTPVADEDASSILSELVEPPPSGGPDSSSVRIEAPGVDRTLAGGPGSGSAFDLTIPDEPAPSGLFDEPGDADRYHGAGKFARLSTEPDIDLGADPAAAGLGDEDAPSSIFAGDKAPATDSDVRLDDPGEAAEFTDDPEMSPADSAERRGVLSTPELPPPAPRKPGRALSSTDFDLPEAARKSARDDEHIDWDAVEPAGDAAGRSDVASLSGILRGDQDDELDAPTRTAPPVKSDPSTPAVTVDWMAGSSEEQAVVPESKARPAAPARGKGRDAGTGEKARPAARAEKPAARPEPPQRDEKTVPRPAKKGGGMAVGVLVGMLVAGGAWAGLYFGGVIPNSPKASSPGPGPGVGGTGGGQGGTPNVTTPAAVTAAGAFEAGDTAKALALLKESPPANTADRAAAGRVRVFGTYRSEDKPAADHPELKQAREELQAVIADEEAAKTPEGERRAVRAMVELGVSHEIAGDRAAARKVYADGAQKFPKHAATFEALIDRLNTLDAAGAAAPGTSMRLAPADAERLLLAATILLQDEPKSDDPEAGVFFWKAVNLAAAGKYGEAVKQIDEAKKAHVKRAKAMAGRGLNPLSDPLEQIFPRACDEMKAHWELRATLYGNPAIAAAIKKDGLPNTINALAKGQADLATEKMKSAKLQKDVDVAKQAAATLQKEADAAKLTAATLKKEADVAKANVKTLEKELTNAKTEITKVKDAAKDDILKAQKDADIARKLAVEADKKVQAAEKAVKERDDVLGAMAKELKAVTTVPEKWTPADLLKAQQSALKTDSAAAIKKVTDAHAAEMKKIKDGHATELTKLDVAHKKDLDALKTEHKKEVAALKTDSAAAMKKLTDTYAAETKKLTDAHAVEVKKLKDATATEVAKAQEGLKKEIDALKVDQKKEVAALVQSHKKDIKALEVDFAAKLGNAVTPGQSLDVWLPLLTDLRRPTDAEPAMAVAAKVLATSPPDSEDTAKARTVNGVALLLKGDLAGAKDSLQSAKRSPAYRAGAGKFWTKAVDQGLEAVDDPLAPYRQPVVIPPIDVRVAAKWLDAGIAAYRAGRFADAEKALADAAKSDPTDPVAWYFLGAARWQRGEKDQARKDFDQGAQREKVSPVPSREVSDMLGPIQGAARAALDRARP